MPLEYIRRVNKTYNIEHFGLGCLMEGQNTIPEFLLFSLLSSIGMIITAYLECQGVYYYIFE